MIKPTKEAYIIALCVLAIVVFGFWKPFAIGQTYFTVISASQIETVYDNKIRQVWYITIAGMPGADRIVGIIDKGVIEQNANVAPVTDFAIDMKINAELKHKITDTGQKIYKYTAGESAPYYCLITPYNCKESYNADWCVPKRKEGISITCVDHYIKKEQNGRAGTLGSEQPQVRTITDFEITAGNKIGTAKLDTYGGKTFAPIVVGGKTYGEISWVGDFVTTIPNSLYPYYVPVNMPGEGWYFVNKRDFENYVIWLNQNLDSSEIGSCLNSVAHPEYTSAICAAQANSHYVTATKKVSVSNLVSVKSESPFGETGIFATTSTTQAYRIPTFRIIADIDWVGIERACANPQITSAEEKKASESGNPGRVVAVIKNIANNPGGLSTRLECPSGIDVLTPTQDVMFTANEQKSFDFFFDMDVTTDITKTCTLISSNKCYENYKEVEKYVTVHGKPGVGCVAGTVTCRDLTNDGIKDVAQCKSDGSIWELKTKCDNNCELTTEGAKCSVSPHKECGDCFSWLWNIFKGKTYCTPKPADKLLWFINIPMTSQNSTCPIFLAVLGSIIALTTTFVIVMIKRR